MNLIQKAASFSGRPNVHECKCKHKLQGTGAVFYQSVGLVQCAVCHGWQEIRKGIK